MNSVTIFFSLSISVIKKTMKLKLALISILTISGIISSQNEQNDYKMIQSECDSLLLNQEIQAISLGVITNGKVYKFHVGKLSTGETPNDNTLYEIASLTKTFTGTLLAQAILEKKATIDDDIRKHLSENFANLEFNQKPITFCHLVTHTNGLPRIFPDSPGLFENPDWDNLPYEINKLQVGFSKFQFFEELHKVALDTVPGFKFSYSNVGANLLGYCLENMYDKPFEELLSEHILKPLQMTKTRITVPSGEDKKLLALGLNPNGLVMPSRAEKEMKAEGGLFSTLDDMIKYMEFQLNEENEVVKISHQELLNGKYGDFENGLFWQIFKNGGNPTKIFQNGGAYGTSSWLTIIPESKVGVIILTNVSGPTIHQKLNATANKIIERLE